MIGISFGIGFGRLTARGGTAPANTVLPAITGTPTSGQTLSVSDGTWTGDAPITYAYQWKGDGTSISGATGSTYTLTDSEIGKVITCTVTATNAAGSASATSAATDAVAAAAALVATKTDTFVTTTNAASPVSTGSKSIGTYAADRKTVISIAHHAGSGIATVTGVTASGVSATKRAGMDTTSLNAQIWTIDTGAGTPFEGLETATFAISCGNSSNHLSLAIYSVPGMNETPAATDISSGTAESVSAANGSVTFAAAAKSSNTAINMAGVTSDYIASQGTFFGGQHGSKASASAETVSVTAAATAMVLATFAPA